MLRRPHRPRRPRRLRLALALALVPLAFAACGDPASPPDAGRDAGAAEDGGGPPPDPEVLTTLGPVRGRRREGVQEYLGIPYAAPPVGDLRFRAPQPHEGWSEPLEARGMPPRCVQFGIFVLPGQEDCLILNVHAPDPLPEGAPVMVWLHGGGFVFGEGVQTDGGTKGDRLALEHGVVVVSVNYRLGPLGFFAHPALRAEEGGEAIGNAGLADQLAALRWVRENIAAFGGDPGNVTLFGESAGGLSVCALLTSPEAEGLFHRAVSQSGLCEIELSSLEEREALGLRYAERLGCPGEGAEAAACLRAVSPDQILALVEEDESWLSIDAVRRWWPYVDGRILQGSFRAQAEAGALHRVPTIVGWNADEGSIFLILGEMGGATPDEATLDLVLGELIASTGADEALVRGHYTSAAFGDPAAAISAAVGHAGLICPSRRAALLLAPEQPTYAYRFSYPDAAFQLPSERPLGAFHSAEIQFVFGHPAGFGGGGFEGEEAALSEAMMAYWARFARGGDPNGDGAVEWPLLTTEGEGAAAYLGFDREIAAGVEPDRDDCALWAPIAGM